MDYLLDIFSYVISHILIIKFGKLLLAVFLVTLLSFILFAVYTTIVLFIELFKKIINK